MMGTLLTIAKTEEKQVFYPWLDKLTVVYTNVEFTLTKKGILGHATSVKLRDSIPTKTGMKGPIPCCRDSRKNGGAGGGDVGLLFNGYKTSFCTVERIMETNVGVGCTA